MDSETIKKRLREAMEEMELDDEVSTFLLYWAADTGYVEGVDAGSFEVVMAALDGLGLKSGGRVRDFEKRGLRHLAMEEIRLMAIRLGRRSVVRSIQAGRHIGVERLEWCNLAELGEIIWRLRRMERDEKRPRSGIDLTIDSGRGHQERT